jgi:hypothetical protein
MVAPLPHTLTLCHQVIYLTVCLLCVGPVITNLGTPADKISVGGIAAQLFVRRSTH